jgi:hypothetical protein
LAFEKFDQLGRFEKRKEKAFVRDVVTPDRSKPSAEEEAKNARVREVQKWMTMRLAKPCLNISITPF